jgi:hypothetical protein
MADNDKKELKGEDIEDKITLDPKVEIVQEQSDKVLSEFLGEPVKDGKVEEDRKEEKKDEPKSPVKEENAEEKIEEGVDFDPDKLGEEVSDKTAKKLLEKLMPENTDKENKDILADTPWAKEKREPTWDEALKWMGDYTAQKVQNDLKAQQEKAAADAKAAQDQRQKQDEEAVKTFNKKVDDQLEDLYVAGKLPRIKDPDDPNDIGKKARVALFQAMFDVNQKRAQEGKEPISSVKEIYYEHYTPPTAQPAGADAPVSPGRGGFSPTEDKEFDYSEIRKTSLEGLLGGK